MPDTTDNLIKVDDLRDKNGNTLHIFYYLTACFP